jgi:hypothetical protein
MRTALTYMIDDLGLWGQAPTPGQPPSNNEEKAHKLREGLDAYAATGTDFVESNPYEDLVRAVTQSMKAASYSLSDDFKCTWNNGTTAANWIARTLNADIGQALTDHPELIEFILKAAAGAYDWIPPRETEPTWQDDDISTWTEDEPLAFDIAFGYFGSQCSVPTSVIGPSDAECSLSQDYVIHYDSLERRNKNLVSSSSDSSMPATVDFANVDAAQWLFPIGVSEDPLSDDFDSFLGEWENYSQSGDSAQSYVDAPLDRDLITIRDNTPLSYWEG